MNAIRQLVTAEGEEAKSLAGVEYPFGGKPPTLLKLDVFRDTKWEQSKIDQASSYIYQSWSWNKQLTGFTESKSNLGGNIIMDLFSTRNVSTIEPVQEFWENVWGKTLQEIGKVINPNQEMYSIKFPSKVDSLLDRLASLKKGTPVNMPDEPSQPETTEVEEQIEELDTQVKMNEERIIEISKQVTDVHNYLKI